MLVAGGWTRPITIILSSLADLTRQTILSSGARDISRPSSCLALSPTSTGRRGFEIALELGAGLGLVEAVDIGTLGLSRQVNCT